MTTTADDRAVSQRRPPPPADRPARRKALAWPLRILGAFALGGAICVFVYSFAGGTKDVAARVLTATVQKADLLITVTEDGNVESANNIELGPRAGPRDEGRSASARHAGPH